ncbi:hypothetical protein F66182_5907 [Fusarium sp. NRRL 66182]|nr:hypothetical protein F66182_5907 [Fusarium sp. NRRL 66182]
MSEPLAPLSKVDSAVQGLSSSPPAKDDTKKAGHRRASSTAPGVMNINDLGKSIHLKGHQAPSGIGFGVIKVQDRPLTCSAAEAQGIDLELAPETQKTGWKINSSPNSVEDPAILKLHLSKPPVKRIDLHFPLGMEVTARNLKGVTIKDALDAIHKAYKKRSDDELDKPYLAGFEWDKEESWTRLVVHLQTQPTSTTLGGPVGGGKKKKNKKQDE